MIDRAGAYGIASWTIFGPSLVFLNETISREGTPPVVRRSAPRGRQG